MNDATLNDMLEQEVGLAQGPFYLGFIDAAGFAAVDDDNDTMASHAGWQEFTGYTGDRPAWAPGAAAAKSIVNPARPTAVTTAAGTIVGVFVTTDSTKGGAAGVMKDVRLLAAPVTFTSGKNLKPQHTFRIRARSNS